MSLVLQPSSCPCTCGIPCSKGKARQPVMDVHILKKKKKEKNYVGRENSPYINSGKRDTLAQRAVSLPHQKMRGELMWIGWVSGSTLLQDTSVMMRICIFYGTCGS
eukprot:1158650-Pelagomonas_calceolata.AAC.4